MSFAKLPREIRNHWIAKDPQALAVFIHLLLDAAYQDQEVIFNGEKIMLREGELILGRHSYAQKTGVSEAVLRRVLRRLKTDQVIGGRTTKRYSVITLLPSELWRPTNHTVDHKEEYINNNNNITEKVGKNPTLPQVVNTFKSKGIQIDAEDFFNYYDARGWTFPNGTKIVNWIALAYSWAKRDKDKAKPETSWEVVK